VDWLHSIGAIYDLQVSSRRLLDTARDYLRQRVPDELKETYDQMRARNLQTQNSELVGRDCLLHILGF